MHGDMKFDDSSLTGYLVNHLEPLTEADPVILAEYVVALLKKDKPLKELEKLCSDNLAEFLGQGTQSFVAQLFEALEDGSIARADENLDVIKKSEPSQFPIKTETVQPKSSLPKGENLSTSSEPTGDQEDKEVTDDDDDDRNHKHRRRDARLNSVDNNGLGRAIRRPDRKRNMPNDHGRTFLETPMSNETRNEYNPTSDRDITLKSEKRRSGLAPLMRPPLDYGPRTRSGQTYRSDLSAHYDLSMAIGRPPFGRGRGGSSVSWGQNDLRFNPLDTLDFPTHIASQGPTHSNLLMGTSLPNAASTQNGSWGAFGFIPGMSNVILDPIHPLNLQGPLQRTLNAPLNLGMPRQRCRDFEEQGFCLRGDMCPMEHGVNRIVVEDVQGLSQFNLPVSIPTSRTGSLPQVAAPSSLPGNTKAIPSKNGKSAMTDDALKLNGVSCASGGDEADVYDPDQPLWNNDCPEASNDLLRLPSPNSGDKHFRDVDSSSHQSFRLSEDIENERSSRSFVANTGTHGSTSSVWGRIGSGAKSEMGSKIADNLSHGNEAKEDHEGTPMEISGLNQGKLPVPVESSSKFTIPKPVMRPRKDPGHSGGNASNKATRTLFVNGIPQSSNRTDGLLSHFQKFGEVIDIYIPMNSEKAFVQFSKREEAEAALKAPDAVMGNRFIKLWWANRDRIPEGLYSGFIKSVQPPGVVGTAVPSQLPFDDRRRRLPSVAQKGSSGPVAETSPSSTVLPKSLLANGLKLAPPVQKKMENLDLLEELRKKQESLAQKRDEFARQLAKFEKHTLSIKKGEEVDEHTVKRHKGEMGHEVGKSMNSKSRDPSTGGVHQESEKMITKSNSGEILVSPSAKAHLTTLQQSPKNIRSASRLPPPSVNRFKLDNRPTAFRVLPPLPADLSDVATLKDHFSSFGDLFSVVLEEPDGHGENTGSGPCKDFSARITFATRHSAEKAYANGKIWHGQCLQFTWITVSPSLVNESCIEGNPSSWTPKGDSNTKVQAELVTSGSSSSSAVQSSGNVFSETATIINGDSMDMDDTNRIAVCVPEILVQTSLSSPTTLCEKGILISAVAIAEDRIDIDCAQ